MPVSSGVGVDPMASTASIVRSLRARGEPPPGRADPEVRKLAAAIVGPGPVAWAAEVAQASTELVTELTPDDRLIPVEDIGHVNETWLLELLAELTGEPMAGWDLGSIAHAITLNIVTRGVPSDRVVTAMRRIQQHWIGQLLVHAAAAGAGPAVLQQITLVTARRFDQAVDAQIKAYLAARERFLSGNLAQGRRIIEALIEGVEIDPGVAQEHLKIDLSHYHVALVLTPHENPAARESDLTMVGAAAGRALAARGVIRYVTGDGALWMWASDPRKPAVSQLRETTFASGHLCLGVGSAQRGPDGFRRSHVEALEAERIARTGRAGPLVLYPDVALAALLSKDMDQARWFVQAQLGPLAATDGQMAELRDTLRRYYLANLKPITAAAQMHLHRNTFGQRLHRIEDLIDRPITDNVAELWCALLLTEEFGSSMLTGPEGG